MNMLWVYDLPNWLFGALTIGTFLSIGLVGHLATRGWVRSLHDEELTHNDIVGFYLGALTVFYGITLGLLMIAVWTNFSETEGNVGKEAATLSALYHDFSHYPEPIRGKLREGLRDYCYNVINVAWPQQRRGEFPTSNRVILRRVEDALFAFEPATQGQMVLHAEAIRQFNVLREERRLRIQSVTAGLSGDLWALVLIGALMNISVTWFFHVANAAMHIWMTVLLSSLLGLMIFLLAAMDHPFLGKLSVGPDAFQIVYDQTILVYDETGKQVEK